jgi:hypothetical protein
MTLTDPCETENNHKIKGKGERILRRVKKAVVTRGLFLKLLKNDYDNVTSVSFKSCSNKKTVLETSEK